MEIVANMKNKRLLEKYKKMDCNELIDEIYDDMRLK